MSALLALQSSLQAHLLDGDGAIEAAIASGHGIDVRARLAIYHHAYRARLADALRDTYAHTASYLGDEWFDAEARAHVELHPSTQANLNAYGAHFAAGLTERQPQRGEVAELAALDWALRRAFDGADATPLELADLAAIAPEAWAQTGFALVPTCRCLTLRHNTVALWHAIDHDQTPPRAEALSTPLKLLIWRREWQPHFRSLAPMEAAALAALAQGRSFAEICVLLAEHLPSTDEAVAAAGTLLRRWVDDGLLGSFVS